MSDEFEGEEPRLTKAQRKAAENLERWELKAYVDWYYADQGMRLLAANKLRAQAQRRDEPVPETEEVALGDLLLRQQARLEDELRGCLATWVRAEAAREPNGATAWALRQVGIGPVLAAALAAHLPGQEVVADEDPRAAAIADMDDGERGFAGWRRVKVGKKGDERGGWARPRPVPPTVGHWWRHAGLDPTLVWAKGERRPWNAALKVICWRIGDSFVKVSGREGAAYGRLYHDRKLYEVERNESGGNKEAAERSLASGRKWGKETRAVYEGGKLPKLQVDLRARRWVVKVFLSHYHEVAYLAAYGTPPPNPYVLEHVPGHVHKIERPA